MGIWILLEYPATFDSISAHLNNHKAPLAPYTSWASNLVCIPHSHLCEISNKGAEIHQSAPGHVAGSGDNNFEVEKYVCHCWGGSSPGGFKYVVLCARPIVRGRRFQSVTLSPGPSLDAFYSASDAARRSRRRRRQTQKKKKIRIYRKGWTPSVNSNLIPI